MAGPGAKSAACRRCSACCGQDPLRIPTPGRCTASACENTGNRPLNIRTPFYGVFDQLGPIRGSDPTVGAARHPSARAAQRDWWPPANGRTASLRLHRQAHAAPHSPRPDRDSGLLDGRLRSIMPPRSCPRSSKLDFRTIPPSFLRSLSPRNRRAAIHRPPHPQCPR